SEVVNPEALAIIKDYYKDWRKLHPQDKFPERLTVMPTSSFWPSFKSTTFYKATTWTFNETDKTVGSIDIILFKGQETLTSASLSCHMK
ncbi:hypothetical protein LZ31DRAFT_429841, partial [Colletotrichum somersetense]